MNQGPFDNDNQFVVSYELLQLLRWLLEFEQDALKKLIQKSITTGTLISSSDLDEDLQSSIIDFFTMLEVLLYESIDEHKMQNVFQKNLIPAINHIDSKVYNNYDADIVNASVNKAKNNSSTRDSAKDIFCKELLKRWKPTKNTIVN